MRKNSIHIQFTAHLTVFLQIFTAAQPAIASSWDPTLLANTEAFQIIDDGDGTDEIQLQFGDSAAETLSWSGSLSAFTFSDDIQVEGNITASGGLTINSDQVGDATLTFGNSLTDQTLTILDASNVFTFSTGATFQGNLSGSSLTISDSPNCFSVGTDATGKLGCATNQQLPAVQARKTDNPTLMNGTFQNITFNLTDLENNASVLDHHDTNRDEIHVGTSGLYQIAYHIDGDDDNDDETSTLESRVTLNGADAAMSGSLLQNRQFQNEFTPNTISFIAALEANDVLRLQARRATTEGLELINETMLNIVKLDGSIANGSFAAQVGQFVDGAGGTDVNTAGLTSVPFNTETRKDNGITHDNITNNSRVQLDSAGWYRVSYNVSFDDSDNNRKNIQCAAYLNGSATPIAASTSYGYARISVNGAGSADLATAHATFAFETSSDNDYYEIQCTRVGSDTAAANLIAGESWTLVENIDGAPLTEGGWTDNGTNVVLTTSTDNVGIGTASPEVEFEVVGTMSGSTIVSNGSFLPVIIHHDASTDTATGLGFQTLKSFMLDGGLLSTSNSIRITAWVRRTTGAGNGTFRATYGGNAVVTMGGGNVNNPVQLEIVIMANGATNAQRGYLDHSNSGNTGTATGTAATDSTTAQTVTLDVDLATDTDVFTMDNIIVEYIR